MGRLYFEDIIGNALIELNSRSGIRQVTMSQLKKYELAVIDDLKKNGIVANGSYIDMYTLATIKNHYCELFNFYADSTGLVVEMKPQVSLDMLKKEFQSYLPIHMLLSFTNPKVLSSLDIYEKQVEEEIEAFIDENTWYMIDVDGVCIDTEQRLSKIASQIGWKDALKMIDWHDHIFASKQINSSLDILREIQKDLKRIALLTTNHSEVEAREKVLYFREKEIQIPIISVSSKMKKSQIVVPRFYNGNIVLVDDKEVNVEDWNEQGGKGVLFTENEEGPFVKVKSLGFLRKIK